MFKKRENPVMYGKYSLLLHRIRCLYGKLRVYDRVALIRKHGFLRYISFIYGSNAKIGR